MLAGNLVIDMDMVHVARRQQSTLNFRRISKYGVVFWIE
jgi:hypothetical protein